MKFQFLSRIPKNKRFNFQPRYYDPIKEEMEERTNRIKTKKDPGERSYRENISAAFRRRSRVQRRSGILQFSFVILFALIFFGYIFYGGKIFFAFLFLIPFYIWIKLKKSK